MRNKLCFTSNLLTLSDSLLKNFGLDLAFIGRSIDIKFHLSNCKANFWRILMQPVGPLQPHLWIPCSPSATSSLNLIVYTHKLESDCVYTQKLEVLAIRVCFRSAFYQSS